MNDMVTYHKCQPKMFSGDLVEWSSASALGAAIRWFTKKDVNHSSLLVRFNYQDLSDRRFVLEAMGGGLEFNLLSKRLKNFKGRVYWHALRPGMADLATVRAKMMSKAILLKAEHVEYDYWGLVKNAAVRVSLNARQIFCSEFYHICAAHANILPVGGALRPGEFGPFNIHLPRVLILNNN